MLTGTVVEIFYSPYAWVQLCNVVIIVIGQIADKGNCPLTTLENRLYERYDPSKVYWDPETHKASFIRHHIKIFGKTLPKGTTTALLCIVLGITFLQLIFK